MWILLAAAAHAACDAPYSRETLAADVGVAQAGLREMDDAAFGDAVRRLEAGLPCLDTVLPPAAMATTYRLIGAGSWLLRDDGVAAGRWFRAAVELDPRYDWDAAEVPLNHPMRRAWETERPAANDVPEPVEGMVFVPGTWHLDGRVVRAPAATPSRPHLLQQVEPSGVVHTWLVYGNRFPADALGAPAPVVEAAPATDGGFDAVTARRERPPAKLPLLLVGTGGVLAAGGVYAASFVTRAGFDAASTTDDATRAAGMTNGLVIGSGGLLLVGAFAAGWSFSL